MSQPFSPWVTITNALGDCLHLLHKVEANMIGRFNYQSLSIRSFRYWNDDASVIVIFDKDLSDPDAVKSLEVTHNGIIWTVSRVGIQQRFQGKLDFPYAEYRWEKINEENAKLVFMQIFYAPKIHGTYWLSDKGAWMLRRSSNNKELRALPETLQGINRIGSVRVPMSVFYRDLVFEIIGFSALDDFARDAVDQLNA